MKRVILVGLGAVLLLAAVIAFGVGTWLWSAFGIDGELRVESGRVTSGPDATAVLTDLVRVNSQVPLAGGLGEVTLGVSAPDGDPLFLGVATPEEVDDYLAGRAYDVARLTGDGMWELTPVPGRGAPDPPAAQTFWLGSASGATPELRVADLPEPITLVVMQADGSPGVDATVSLTFRSTSIRPLVFGLLGGGLAAAVVGGLLLAWGLRTGRTPAVHGRHAAGAPVAASPVPAPAEPPAVVPEPGPEAQPPAMVPVPVPEPEAQPPAVVPEPEPGPEAQPPAVVPEPEPVTAPVPEPEPPAADPAAEPDR